MRPSRFLFSARGDLQNSPEGSAAADQEERVLIQLMFTAKHVIDLKAALLAAGESRV